LGPKGEEPGKGRALGGVTESTGEEYKLIRKKSYQVHNKRTAPYNRGNSLT